MNVYRKLLIFMLSMSLVVTNQQTDALAAPAAGPPGPRRRATR